MRRAAGTASRPTASRRGGTPNDEAALSVQTENRQDVDLHRVLAVIRRRAWLVALLTVVAAVVAFAVANRAPNLYQATAEVRITNPNSDNVFQSGAVIAVDSERLVDTESRVIESNTIRNAVKDEIQGHADDIDSVTVANPSGTDLLQISVTSESPEVARDAANAFAVVYISTRKAQAVSVLDQKATELRDKATELGTQIQDLDDRIADNPDSADDLQSQRSALVAQQTDFSNRASQFEVESGLRSGNVQPVDVAELPTDPISPTPTRDAAIAGILGFLVGLGLVFLLDRLDDRIADPAEVEGISGGAPLLGSIPIYAPGKRRGARSIPSGTRALVPLNSVDAEVYRTLRTSIRFSSLGTKKKIILITSSSGGEGKSTVTTNLAVSLAEGGNRVVVVSADLRRPVLANIFGIPETTRGLTSVLLGDATLTECLVPYELERGRRLYVLPSGPLPPNPAELLGSRAMGTLLASLTNADVDYVLVDCAPVLPVSDPLAVAQFADSVLVLSVLGKTRRRDLAEACSRLHRVGADIDGIIVNGVPTGHGYGTYGYFQRYDTRAVPEPDPVDRSNNWEIPDDGPPSSTPRSA